MGTLTENKKIIKEFKDLNSFVLELMIEKDPEIYSAVAKVLDSIERKYFYSQETEAKQWTLNDFENKKIVVDTPEKSKRFQELLLSLGAMWSGYMFSGEEQAKQVKHTDEKYLGIRNSGNIFYFTSKVEYDYESMDEIFYDDIFPSEIETKQQTETNPLTLNELMKTTIYLPTSEMREEFQKILFDLGGKWDIAYITKSQPDETKIMPDTLPYYSIDNKGRLEFDVSMDVFDSYRYKDITQEWPEMKKRYVPISASTKQYILDDFKTTKIIVDTPEKSKKFQEFLFKLGAEWKEVDVPEEDQRKSVNFLNEKYLVINYEGNIFYLSKESYRSSSKKEIFYDDIFPEVKEDIKQKEPVSTTYTSLKDFYKSKIEVNESQSKELQEYLFRLGSKWFTGNRDLKWFDEKYLIIDEKGILKPVTKLGFDETDYKRIYFSDIFRTDIERAFKDEPVESDFLTWPKPEIATIYRIEKNKGDRKSPTQSAGELKDLFNDEESKTELFATYFRGNDNNWYRLYEDKNGTWRWSKQATPKQLK